MSQEALFPSLADATQGYIPCWTFGTPSVIYISILKRFMVAGITGLIPSLKKGRKCKSSSWYFNANFVYGPETEWMIEQITCGSEMFACPLGQCLPLSSLCDGIRDCPTGDDEEKIYCDITNRCKSQPEGRTHPCGFGAKCIRPDQLCDGEPQCENGNDEAFIRCNSEQDMKLNKTGLLNDFLEGKRCTRIPISEVRLQ